MAGLKKRFGTNHCVRLRPGDEADVEKLAEKLDETKAAVLRLLVHEALEARRQREVSG